MNDNSITDFNEAWQKRYEEIGRQLAIMAKAYIVVTKKQKLIEENKHKDIVKVLFENSGDRKIT